MKIHNVRLGHATNSSSTHSLIFLPPGRQLRTTEYTDFGWEYFTAADEASKANYLGVQLQVALHDLEPAAVSRILEDVIGQVPPDDAYVDHQSLWDLPRAFDGSPPVEFFKALANTVVKGRVAILGGNDNGGDPENHPDYAAGSPASLEGGLHLGGVVRNDKTHWVVYNRGTGGKVRLTFEDSPEITKARAPELVDIKLTGYCPFGCSYCYQSSTRQGQHASWESIEQLVQVLRELEVFEVAIGGGEPTLHPQFKETLELFSENRIRANFTTRNLAWFNKPEHVDTLKNCSGAFAFSVERGEDIERLHSLGIPKAQVQYTLGTGDLSSVLHAAHTKLIPVTLLGFKRVGFGTTFDTQTDRDWVKQVEAFRVAQKLHRTEGYLRLSVDTALVDEDYDRICSELHVSPLMLTREEGKFSMYVDLVTQQVAPSSYCAEALYEPLQATPEGILNAFKKW